VGLMAGLVDQHLEHEVTIVRRGTLRSDGTYPYTGASTATLAWVRDKAGVLRGEKGRELVYQRVVYLSTSETISLQDRIVYNGVNHEVLMIDRNDDITGEPDHIKCYVGVR
jgi:hypothetical protein